MTNQGFKSVSDWTVFCSALCVSKLALLCMSFSLMPKHYCLVFTFSSFSSVFVFDVSCARLIATSCFILESFLCVGLPVFVFFPHVLWLFSPHLLVSPLSSYSCVLVGSPASFLPTLIVSFFFCFLFTVCKNPPSQSFFVWDTHSFILNLRPFSELWMNISHQVFGTNDPSLSFTWTSTIWRG